MIKSSATALIRKVLFNKKRMIIIILIFSLVTFTGMIVSSTVNSLSVFIEKSINNRIDTRTIYVSYEPLDYTEDGVINKLKEIPHSLAIVPDQSKNVGGTCIQFLNFNGLDGQIEIRGTNMEIMASSNKISNLENGTCLIPEVFYPDSYLEENMNNRKCVNGKDYIGKVITFSIPQYQFCESGLEIISENKYDFLVVDTYNSMEYLTNDNVIYATFDDVNNMNEGNYNMQGNSQTIYPVVVYVDSFINVEKVITQINSMGFYPTIKAVYNSSFLYVIEYIGFLVCFVCVAFSSVICGVLTLKSIDEIKTEIGLLKAIGFKNIKIGSLIMNNVLAYAFGGGIIGMMFFLMTVLLISKRLSFYSYWSKMNISIDVVILLIVFSLISLVTLVVALLSYIKIYKTDPLDILYN